MNGSSRQPTRAAWQAGRSGRRAAVAATAAAALAAATAAAAVVTAGASSLTWSQAAAAVPANTVQSILQGIACSSATACVAVGNQTPTGSSSQPLAESWDGTAWSVVATPALSGTQSASFAGVACTGSALCVAVGYQSIAATGQDQPLIETWNASVWSLASAPTEGTSTNLDGVSCASPTSCMAVGNTGGSTFAEHWDGASWTVSATANPGTYNSLTAVSCAATSSCLAVGYNSVGTGGDATLAELWNGSGWAVVPTPNPTANSFFYGVSCVAVNSCIAVGSQGLSNGDNATLVESWTSTTWTILPSPVPAGTPDAGFNAAACTSPASCIAVGRYFVTGGGYDTLIESWDGSGWTIVSSPNPSAENLLQSATCSSPSWCAAAGFTGPTDRTAPLIVTGVSATPTGTTLASSANPAVVGQQVTYTATVSPVPDGGTVSFTDGSSAIAGCAAVPVASGVASCTTSALGTGIHAIAARYSGDATTAASSASTGQSVGYAMALLYSATSPVRSGSTLVVRVELQDAAGNDFSASGISLTAQCVVLQPATTCASPLRTVNQAFSFTAGSKRGPASYSFSLSTKGLASGSYDLVVTVAGDPTQHVAPFAVG